MTTWSVSIEAALSSPIDDFEDRVDELLTLLESHPVIIGPVTFLNLSERSFGARFTLQSEDMQSAIDRAIALFVQDSQKLGLSFVLRGGSVLVDDSAAIDRPDKVMAST
jgi:hypothetical protein